MIGNRRHPSGVSQWRTIRAAAVLTLGAALLAAPARAAAQQTGSDALAGHPPAPVAPDVITRDAANRATVRAVRITEPLQMDGRLDEAVYTSVPPMSGFIQTDPDHGAPATEKTDVWLFFDDDNVYVVGRAWETEPDRLVANEMRRDNITIVRNDNFAWSFDTFHDHRNGVLFEVNAIGGRIDAQVTNESQVNLDWNPIWDFGTGYFDGGYVVEAAIPFKSLRYRPGREQVWGFQARRTNRWKNEVSYITPVPPAFINNGHFRSSLSAAVVGLEAPPTSRLVEIKPYAIADMSSDPVAAEPFSNDFGGSGGLDVKYGITQNLTADFTVNTDFAQVEADEQQVNLTRFSLFFPEKREFFLENQGLFAFGGAGAGPFGAGDTPVLFYSRNIGLDRGREIPIDAGARMTGRVGAFNVGVLNIQTGDHDGGGDPSTAVGATNFSVVRIKRDLLRRSSIGAIATRRSIARDGQGSAETYGVDGTFGFYDAADHKYLLGDNTPGAAATGGAGRGSGRRQLPGAARLPRRPLRRGAGAAGGGGRIQSRGRLHAPRGFRPQPRGYSGSARARSRSRRSAASFGKGASIRSPAAAVPAASIPSCSRASLPWRWRTATASPSTTSAATSMSIGRTTWRVSRTSRSASAAIVSRTSSCRTSWARSAGSAVPSRHNTAASSAARRRPSGSAPGADCPAAGWR